MSIKSTFIFVGPPPPGQQAALEALDITVHTVATERHAKALAKKLEGPIAIAKPKTLVTPFRSDIFEDLPPGLEFDMPELCKLACEIDPDDNEPGVLPFPNGTFPPELSGYTPVAGQISLQDSSVAVLKKIGGAQRELGHLLMVREGGTSDQRDIWYWDGSPWPKSFSATLPPKPAPSFEPASSAIVFKHQTFKAYSPPPFLPTTSYSVGLSPNGAPFAHLKLKGQRGRWTAYWWASPGALSEGLVDMKVGSPWFFKATASNPPTYWRYLKAGQP